LSDDVNISWGSFPFKLLSIAVSIVSDPILSIWHHVYDEGDVGRLRYTIGSGRDILV